MSERERERERERDDNLIYHSESHSSKWLEIQLFRSSCSRRIPEIFCATSFYTCIDLNSIQFKLRDISFFGLIYLQSLHVYIQKRVPNFLVSLSTRVLGESDFFRKCIQTAEGME